MDSRVAFQGNADSHKDRHRQHDGMTWIQKHRKQLFVQVCGHVKAFAKTFKNASKEVSGINEAQGDEHKIEAVDHFFVRQDDNRDHIEQDTGNRYRYL